MFGYVRPLKGELKVRHFEMYQAAYCGLCRAMKNRYGFASTLFLNYDLAFLASVLLGMRGETGYDSKRCISSPFKKKKMCKPSSALDDCAAISVLLSCGKMRDDIVDKGLLFSLPQRVALALQKNAEQEAAKDMPQFAEAVKKSLLSLRKMEEENCEVLDAAADSFAAILAAAADCQPDTPELKKLLYHVGRWIYIVDAADDLKKDVKKGNYNPLVLRFKLADGNVSIAAKDYILSTLGVSVSIACDAATQLELGQYGPIVGNILALGLPFVAERVMDGTWRASRK